MSTLQECLPVFGYVIVERHVTPDTPIGPTEYNTDTHFDFEPFIGVDNIAVVKHADAQATIDALRAEVERLNATRPNIDAFMALADVYAEVAYDSGYFSDGSSLQDKAYRDRDTAREALRAELAKGML